MSFTLVLVTQATQALRLGPNLACAAGLGLLSLAAARMPAARVAASPVRAAVLDALSTGRCFTASELARVAGVSRKTAEYHLHVLERAGLAGRVRSPTRTLFVAHARGADPARRALEHPARRALFDAARARPGASVPDLARVARLRPSTAYFHVRVLEQHGLLVHGPAGVHARPSADGEADRAVA